MISFQKRCPYSISVRIIVSSYQVDKGVHVLHAISIILYNFEPSKLIFIFEDTLKK